MGRTALLQEAFPTIWAGNDPGNLGRPGVQQLLIDRIPGAAGRPHTGLPEAGRFLHDDQRAQIARLMVDFIEAERPDAR